MGDSVDSLREEVSDRELLDIVGCVLREERDAVGESESLEGRVGDFLEGVPCEDAVGDIGADGGGVTAFDEGLSGVAEGSAAIDDVIDEDAVPVLDIADDIHDF